jgi:hypothetical protein
MSDQHVERGDDGDGVSIPGRRTERLAKWEAVAYAIDLNRTMSATPSTLIGDVAGVADRRGNLSLA